MVNKSISLNNVFSINNAYTLELIDSRTNKLKQKVCTTNILLNSFYARMLGHSSEHLRTCAIGTGSGTPAETDTGLFKHLYSVDLSEDVAIKSASKSELIVVYKFTFPATTNCSGTITEIGLSSYNGADGYAMVTHAMLKDSEGNLITIEKTDIDKLIVTVEVRVRGGVSSNGFNFDILYDIPFSINKYSDSYYALWHSDNQIIFANCCFYGPKSMHDSCKCTKYASPTLSDNNHTFKYKNCRLGTTEFNGMYINTIFVKPFGFFKFPNADVMPNTPLTGITIGTGDGSTDSFDSPIPLFVKDSDKVYIDGVLQTRGVDYTIDHKANRQVNWSITPGNFVKKLYGDGIVYTSASTKFIPFTRCIAYADEFIAMHYNNNAYIALTGDYPITLELDDESIELDVNTCLFRYFYIKNSSGATKSVTGVYLVLEYSNDNQVFTEACRFSLNNHSYSKQYKATFDTVVAKYWRISLDFTEAAESTLASKSDTYIEFNLEGYSYNDYGNTSLLYYLGEPIQFTTPPAEGAVITMDCELDRPYKTSNWVIDCNPEFQV